MKRILCLLLAAVMLLGLCACGGDGGNTDKTDSSDQEILQARRDTAEAYMRKMGTFLWRAQEDVTYSIRYDDVPVDQVKEETPKKLVYIMAGRVYRGLPYTHGAGNLGAFQAFAAQPDEKGISNVSGLTWQPMNGDSNAHTRISTDCSGAITIAWNTVATSPRMCGTQYMTENNGYLKVGEYETQDLNENIDTNKDCETNGTQVMYEAYAKLQKADIVVRRKDGSGHVLMISSINVVRNEEGKVSGRDSSVTVLHQTNDMLQSGKAYYDETLGESVYYCFGIDEKFTFSELYNRGYLPVTCKELIDASVPAASPTVTDSETEFTKDTICKGTLTSQMTITSVTVAITDAEGKEVQKATCFIKRNSRTEFQLDRLLTEYDGGMLGKLDPEALTAGNYHCTMTCVLTDDTVVTVRDFDFTV